MGIGERLEEKMDQLRSDHPRTFEIIEKTIHVVSIGIFGALTLLSLTVFITAVAKDFIFMQSRVGFNIYEPGNLVGLYIGFLAYGVFCLTLFIPRMKHNLDWFMKFTHELSHTLVAILFFSKIREFVVKDRECYVNYKAGLIGYVPTTLAPYCIPIYTLMIFPFRFAGDSHYMLFFDVLIAFTYAFHIHSFIKQTSFRQSDIRNCGPVLSTAFISFVHLTMMSLILAIPRGGLVKAMSRVFCKYPGCFLNSPADWFHDIIHYF